MRVLHVTNAYPSLHHPVKGIFIKEQIDSLKDVPGLAVDVLVVETMSGTLRGYVKALFQILRCAREYDVIHAHHVFCGVLSVVAGVRKKLVISFLNDSGRNIIGLPKFLSGVVERIVHHASRAAIFKSPSFQPMLRRQDRIIPNGVHLPALVSDREYANGRRDLLVDDSDIAVLFVSANSLTRRSKRYDRFKLVVGEIRALGHSVSELLLVDVPREDVGKYFCAADCYVVVSDFEGSPNAVKEALAYGVPVISMNVGDVRSQICGVEGSRVFASFDARELASAVVAATGQTKRKWRQEQYRAKAPTPEWAAREITKVYVDLCHE